MTTKSMRPATILRIASALAAVQYGAHAFLFLLAASTNGPGKMAEIAATRWHSYWDFYFGYGLLAILSGLIEVVLLWQLASLAQVNADRIRPTMAVFVFANVAHAFLVWKYFSLFVPIAFDILIATLLSYAFVMARRRDVQSIARSKVEDSLHSQSKT
ncbi:MAG: hypothetical protein DMC59_02300 [Verrucomicrobia bacterium]|nr:MAG: hypothetical protein DMC59_02300 [Verrucomicrobiota bacterium]